LKIIQKVRYLNPSGYKIRARAIRSKLRFFLFTRSHTQTEVQAECSISKNLMFTKRQSLLIGRYINLSKATGKKIDPTTRNQLRRAVFSVMLNIAEGSSRFSNADRRNFYFIARGSVFECVAIFDFMKEEYL
jgi:four helix bundle protein